MNIFAILKFIKIGRIIFNLTSDALEIVNDNSLSEKEKAIEVLKAIPDSVLELGKNEK